MSDLIDRQAVIDILDKAWVDGMEYEGWLHKEINELPTAELRVIHCKDCKWWDKTDGEMGYCLAAKHGYYSTHWEISIYRTYDGEFYCADAERRTDEADYRKE